MISHDEKGSAQAHLVPASVARVHPVLGLSSSNDPSEIRAEMAHTRAEMSMTIDALQERLDPQRLKEEATTKARDTANRLKEQATQKVRAATIGRVEGKVGEIVNKVEDTAYETRYGIADAIRQNPIPAALVGVGLAWMFFSGSDRNAHGNRPYGRYATYNRSPGLPLYGGIHAPPVRTGSLGGSVQDTAQNVAGQAGAKVQQAGQRVQQLGSHAQDQVENIAGQVKGTVQQLGSQAQDQVESLTGQVKGTAEQLSDKAQDQVEELGSDLQDQVQSLTSELQLQAQRLSGSINRVLRENPLSLGAVAIALGAAAGVIAPQTPQEDQLFGDAREHVLQKAQVVAHDALDQVQKVAEPAQQTPSAAPR